MSVTWTSGYLQALAGFVGLVAVGGLLLYSRRGNEAGSPPTRWPAGWGSAGVRT